MSSAECVLELGRIDLTDRHIGFEKLSMENIDAVLKGQPPLTPVNLHLLSTKSKVSA